MNMLIPCAMLSIIVLLCLNALFVLFNLDFAELSEHMDCGKRKSYAE